MMFTTTRQIRQSTETWARRRWLAFIVGIFIFQAALWVFAISLVASDASHAVVSDYDQRALDWDRHLHRRQRSAALGWSASIAVEPGPVTGEDRLIVIGLEDASALPVDDARVELTLFHQARASERRTITLQPIGLGRYEGLAPMNQGGKWRFELLARRGEDELVVERVQALHLEE
jgi:nitrogen fixation protein FixH